MNSELRLLVVLTPFGYVDQRDNNVNEHEPEKNRANNNKFINHENHHHHHHQHQRHHTCRCVMCVCVRARKKGDHRNDKRSDSL